MKIFSLVGKVITGNAGFRYKSVADAVVEAGGEWIFTLKGNQRNTYRTAKEVFSDDNAEGFHTTFDHGHGRDEIRTYQIRKVPENFPGKK